MDAVILVGGFGTRLRPLTLTTPKPLLPVGNVSILARVIAGLEKAGVTRAILALGFKPQPFIDAFPGNQCGGVRLEYAVEPEPLDTGGAIAFAARFAGISQTFIVVNGDVLTSLDVSTLVAFHKKNAAEGTLHLTPVEDPSQFGVVETASDGQVTRFVEKPAPGETTSFNVNAGTYVLEPSVIERMAVDQKISIERVVFPAMVAQGTLFAMPTADSWIDTGRPETYIAANMSALENTQDNKLVHEASRVATTATIEQSVVGPLCVVGEYSHLSHSVVIAGAEIGESAAIENSVIMGVVGSAAQLKNCIIGADGVVEQGEVLNNVKRPSPDGA